MRMMIVWKREKEKISKYYYYAKVVSLLTLAYDLGYKAKHIAHGRFFIKGYQYVMLEFDGNANHFIDEVGRRFGYTVYVENGVADENCTEIEPAFLGTHNYGDLEQRIWEFIEEKGYFQSDVEENGIGIRVCIIKRRDWNARSGDS